MELINNNVNQVEVGGIGACFVACGGFCFITEGVMTAVAAAFMLFQ